MKRTDEELTSFTYCKTTGKFFNKNGKEIGSYTRKYGRLFYKGKEIKLARLACFLVNGKWPEGEVDHVNRNKHDNRWENLRECSRAENAKNRSRYKNNSSGFKGVIQRKDTGKYRAQIRVDGLKINLGQFDTPEEAADAYANAAIEFHKDFANTGVN